jgi:hypothetical protein
MKPDSQAYLLRLIAAGKFREFDAELTSEILQADKDDPDVVHECCLWLKRALVAAKVQRAHQQRELEELHEIRPFWIPAPRERSVDVIG